MKNLEALTLEKSNIKVLTMIFELGYSEVLKCLSLNFNQIIDNEPLAELT